MKYIRYLFIPLFFLNSVMASSEESRTQTTEYSNSEQKYHSLVDEESIVNEEPQEVVELVTSSRPATFLRDQEENNCCPEVCNKKRMCQVCYVVIVTAGTGIGTWGFSDRHSNQFNRKGQEVAISLASLFCFCSSSLCAVVCTKFWNP